MTVSKSNRTIEETAVIDIPNSHIIHDCAFSRHGTGSSVKSDGVVY